jgi:hypothetical protein
VNESVSVERLDERIRATRREFKLKAKAEKLARRLAAVELARRLDVLNGDHERQRELLGLTVTRERFDQTISDMSGRMGRMENSQSEQRGRMWLPMIAVAAIVAGLVELGLRLLTTKGGP